MIVRFPVFDGDKWSFERLQKHCDFITDTLLTNGHFPISIGSIYRYFRHQLTNEQVIVNTDRIIAEAGRLARTEARLFMSFSL
jgi:hypothetical protein